MPSGDRANSEAARILAIPSRRISRVRACGIASMMLVEMGSMLVPIVDAGDLVLGEVLDVFQRLCMHLMLLFSSMGPSP